jgi:hypothetical protein
VSIYFSALALTILIEAILYYFPIRRTSGKIVQSFLISLPLACLAGLRTSQIGTDISVYGAFNFRMAHAFSSLFDYYAYLKNVNNTEFGYAALNFITGQFTDSLNWFLFILSIVTLVPLFFACLKLRERFNISLTLQTVLYFAVFFGPSLNAMRQSLAMSWIFLAFTLLLTSDKPNWPVIFGLFAIAFSFHRTALFGAGIIIAYYFFVGNENRQSSSVGRLFSVLAIVAALLFAVSVLQTGQLPSFLSKYSQYISGDNALTTKNTGIVRILALSVFPLISAVMITTFLIRDGREAIHEKEINRDSQFKWAFLLALLVADILCQWSGVFGGILTRLGKYYSLLEVAIVPLTLYRISERNLRLIVYIVVILYYLFTFFYITSLGENEIYPYQWVLNMSL